MSQIVSANLRDVDNVLTTYVIGFSEVKNIYTSDKGLCIVFTDNTLIEYHNMPFQVKVGNALPPERTRPTANTNHGAKKDF